MVHVGQREDHYTAASLLITCLLKLLISNVSVSAIFFDIALSQSILTEVGDYDYRKCPVGWCFKMGGD